MNLEVWTTLLIALTPTLTNVITLITGIITFFKAIKANNKKLQEELNSTLSKLNRAYDDIAKMKVQLESINKYLIEQKEKKK